MKTTVVVHPYYFSRRKRLFELSLLVLCSPIFLVLFGVIALQLLLRNGRPILFWQQRLGQHKKTFWMVKFRTMHTNAEALETTLQRHNESTYPAFKIKNDPRFVSAGKWLSQTGLDELPQVWNILKNEMSLIGPRPLPVHQAKKLPSSFHFRFLVKPGIISAWVTSENRHQSLHQWHHLDQVTVQHSGLIKDAQTLKKTFWKQVQRLKDFS